MLLLSTTFPNKFNALHIAACRSNFETCKDLLKINYDQDSSDSKPHFTNLISSLTKHGNSALHYATQNNNHELIEYFLAVQGGIDVNTVDGNGLGAIHIAAQLGFSNALEKLLNVEGVDVEASTNNGYTSKCAIKVSLFDTSCFCSKFHELKLILNFKSLI